MDTLGPEDNELERECRCQDRRLTWAEVFAQVATWLAIIVILALCLGWRPFGVWR